MLSNVALCEPQMLSEYVMRGLKWKIDDGADGRLWGMGKYLFMTEMPGFNPGRFPPDSVDP